MERGVTFHQDVYYKGDSVSLPLGRYTADSNEVQQAYAAWKAAPSGRFRGPWPLLLDTDSCSSITIPEGFCVKIHRDGLAGNYSTIARSMSIQTDEFWNDQISAVEVRRAVVIYEHGDYKGAWSNLKPGDYPNAAAFRLANDALSSIKVPDDLTVTLYEDENFQGASMIVDRDMPYIGSKLNDRVSSVKVSSRGVTLATPVSNAVADEG